MRLSGVVSEFVEVPEGARVVGALRAAVAPHGDVLVSQLGGLECQAVLSVGQALRALVKKSEGLHFLCYYYLRTMDEQWPVT